MLFHSHSHFATILVMILFVLSGQSSTDEATDRSILLVSFARGIGLLLILLPLSLGNSSDARRKLGWIRPKLSDLPRMLLLVASTLLIASLFPLPSSNAELDSNGSLNAALFTLSLILASISEEIFFRSWMLSTLMASGVPRVLTVLISAIAFASIHLWQGFHGTMVATLVGLVYALFFLYRRNLTVLIVAHAIHNIIALLYH